MGHALGLGPLSALMEDMCLKVRGGDWWGGGQKLGGSRMRAVHRHWCTLTGTPVACQDEGKEVASCP